MDIGIDLTNFVIKKLDRHGILLIDDRAELNANSLGIEFDPTVVEIKIDFPVEQVESLLASLKRIKES